MMLDLGWGLNAAIIFGSLLVLIATGMPVAMAMLTTVIIVMLLFIGPSALTTLPSIAFEKASEQMFSVIPLFVMMALVAATTGTTEKAFRAGLAWFGKMPGNLAISSQFAATAFASVSGSSPATAAAVGYFAIPEMVKNGYQKSFAVGAVAAGGTLGILIPPSIAMIVFGLITETSIGSLFIAGILPGIMMATLLVVYIALAASVRPSLAPRVLQTFTFIEKVRSLAGLWPLATVFVLVMGTIYTGIATASEAAAVGAVAAVIIALIQRTLTWSKLYEALRSAAETTAMILLLVIGGFGLSFLFTRLGVARGISQAITESSLSPWGVMLMVVLVLLILGTVLDPMSLIVVTMPLFFPVLTELGFDPIWLGVIVVIAVEIGLITPPVGMNMLILRNAIPGGSRMADLFKGIVPFVGVLLAGMGIILAFPAIATWLPTLMNQ